MLSSKKVRTSAEQMAIQRLFNEQQKILLSGKIIPTVPGQNSNSLTFVSLISMFLLILLFKETDV